MNLRDVLICTSHSVSVCPVVLQALALLYHTWSALFLAPQNDGRPICHGLGAASPVSVGQESSCEEGKEDSFYTAIKDEASEAVNQGPMPSIKPRRVQKD